ncbi:hypothetical protein MRB53_013081 [Persea americana]|uniref:Uncharacterized protein n=1 Tax=Persea americana TaxID=3435 RepID=A0ACC2K714_PERAE|nr:hypothetical protein MRB53_013081 [Persea americana]
MFAPRLPDFFSLPPSSSPSHRQELLALWSSVPPPTAVLVLVEDRLQHCSGWLSYVQVSLAAPLGGVVFVFCSVFSLVVFLRRSAQLRREVLFRCVA